MKGTQVTKGGRLQRGKGIRVDVRLLSHIPRMKPAEAQPVRLQSSSGPALPPAEALGKAVAGWSRAEIPIP
jgi:hypothetical protein